jgi:hypothetical protein
LDIVAHFQSFKLFQLMVKRNDDSGKRDRGVRLSWLLGPVIDAGLLNCPPWRNSAFFSSSSFHVLEPSTNQDHQLFASKLCPFE